MVDTNVRQQDEIKAVCSTSPEQCQEKYGYLVEQWDAFDTTIKNLAKDESLPDEFRNYMPAVYMLGMEAEGVTVEHGWTKRFEAMGFDAETAQMIAATLPALVNGGSGKGGKGNGNNGANNNTQSSVNSSNQLTINKGQQNKHIEGTNEHKISLNANQNKSIITVPPETLLSNLGKGQQVGKIPVGQPGSKERINYGKNIGNYTDPETGKSQPTTNGIGVRLENGKYPTPSLFFIQKGNFGGSGVNPLTIKMSRLFVLMYVTL